MQPQQRGAIILIIFAGVTLTSAADLPVSLIVNYAKKMKIQVVHILDCGELEQEKSNIKILSENGIATALNPKIYPHRPFTRVVVVLNLSCEFAERVIQQATKERSMNPGSEWILLDNANTTDSLTMTPRLRILNSAYMLPGSCVTLVQIADSRVALYDVYRIDMSYPLKFNLLTVQNGNATSYSIPRRKDRSDFERILFHSATVIYWPNLFTNFDDLSNYEVDAWTKIHYPIAVYCSYLLNFRFNMTLSEDYGWEKNGSFSAVMGLLERDEIAFGGTGFFMRFDRMRVVDFTIVMFDLGSAIIFKQPKLSSVSNIFLLPFSSSVWIVCCVMSLILLVFLAVELFLARRTGLNIYNEENVSIVDIVTVVFGFICQQGSNIVAETAPARIATFLFLMSTLFLYTSYSAYIVALLRSSTPVLKTLGDITNSRLGMILENRVYNQIYLKEATDPKIVRLYHKKILPKGQKCFLPPRQGVALMRTGRYAYNVDKNAGYKFISDTFEEAEKCSLSEIPLFQTPMLSFPVPKGSGLREHFTRKLCWLKENGLASRVAAKWIPSKPRCENKGATGFTSVGITEFLPALLALLYGMLFAFVVFVLELVSFYHNKIFRAFKKKKNGRLVFEIV